MIIKKTIRIIAYNYNRNKTFKKIILMVLWLKKNTNKILINPENITIIVSIVILTYQKINVK
jgi:hypothetical protein